MRRQDKLKNIEEANKRLLGESFHMPDGTPIPVDNNHMPIVKEDHETTDEGKMEYIKGALKNLSSEDLNKVYLDVEKFDPEYDSENNSEYWKRTATRGDVNF